MPVLSWRLACGKNLQRLHSRIVLIVLLFWQVLASQPQQPEAPAAESQQPEASKHEPNNSGKGAHPSLPISVHLSSLRPPARQPWGYTVQPTWWSAGWWR